MIQTEEGQDGTLLLVNGADKAPLEDAEMTALLRSLKRLQEGLDKDKSPEKVAELMVTSGARLLLRLGATIASRLQELDDDLAEVAAMAEQGGGGETPQVEGILLTIDECRIIVNPLFAAANTFGGMAQQIAQAPQDPNAPPREQLAATYQQVQEAIGMAASRIAFGLKAYEAAAAEEAAAEAAEEADGGEGEDDEEEDEGDA